MEKKQRTAVAAPISTYKDKNNCELIKAETQNERKAIVFEMFKNDNLRVTAMGLNVMIGFNDARRYMTDIRRLICRQHLGYRVKTTPVKHGSRRVIYQLVKTNAQPTLF